VHIFVHFGLECSYFCVLLISCKTAENTIKVILDSNFSFLIRNSKFMFLIKSQPQCSYKKCSNKKVYNIVIINVARCVAVIFKICR